MTEIEEKNEHLAFLTLIERSKRQNALMHLKKSAGLFRVRSDGH